MGKLSKLTNSFSLSDISFDGFSTSAKWVGYFQKKGDFSYSLVEEAISLFESFFGSKNNKIVVVTALSFRDDREEDAETIGRFQSTYDEMKLRKLLLPMTDEYESYLYGECPLGASSLSFSLECSDFVSLSKLLMCHAGVVGQVCFYIDPAINVAVYPHDDLGYGCVALNGDEKACRGFLDYCSGNDNFEVVLDEAG